MSAPPAASNPPAITVRGLRVEIAGRTILRDVDLDLAAGAATAILGPSGAGKTSFLRTLNRMIELTAGARVAGEVRVGERSIYDREVDADALRRSIGYLFQQPIVFPGSIGDNAAFGLVRGGVKMPRSERRDRVEAALRQAALWREVEDRLDQPAASLSVGQQQRLCLARTLALEPAVLLLDEPTSALDPHSTAAIEERIAALRGERTVVWVTHAPAQAERIADAIAVFAVKDGAGVVGEHRTAREFPAAADLASAG